MRKSTGDIINSSLKQMADNKKKSDIRKRYGVGQLEDNQDTSVKTSVCGITSIICGIVGFFLWIIGLVGVIFGIAAIKNKSERQVPAIAGTVISIIAVIWPIVAYLVILLTI